MRLRPESLCGFFNFRFRPPETGSKAGRDRFEPILVSLSARMSRSTTGNMADAAAVEQLLKIALAARCALERYASDTKSGLFEGFPRGTCGPVSELLGRYLVEAGFKNVMYVGGEKRSEGSHAWIEVGEIILDITGDQFGQPPVVVATASNWHDEWERDDPRPPICTHEQWPAYPFAAWAAMKAGIDASRRI